MNDHQYKECAARIIQTFPELGEWFRSLPDESTRATQRELSKSLISPLEASDVLLAIEDLSKLAEPPWMKYGRLGKGAAFIADAAREFAGKRRERESADRLCAAARRKRSTTPGENPFKASGLIKELLDARAAGQCQTAAETRAWFDQKMPGEDDMRDAVRCSVCQDSGRVQCLIQVRRNQDGSWRKWYGVAACHCEAGVQPTRYHTEAARLVKYDDTEHIRVIPGATDEDLRVEIRRVQERRANRNRVPGFDRFNQREAEFI